MYVLQELALRCRRVAHDAHVDVAAELHAFPRLLVDSSKKHEENPTFYLGRRFHNPINDSLL